MTPKQLKMARAATGLGVRDLAELAGISKGTISRYETEQGGLQAETRDKLQAALESAGVEFIPENGGGAGVRLAIRKT